MQRYLLLLQLQPVCETIQTACETTRRQGAVGQRWLLVPTSLWGDTWETIRALELDSTVGFLCKDDSCFSRHPTHHPLRHLWDTHQTACISPLLAHLQYDSLEALISRGPLDLHFFGWYFEFPICFRFSMFCAPPWECLIDTRQCLDAAVWIHIPSIHGRINGSKFWQDFWDPSGP